MAKLEKQIDELEGTNEIMFIPEIRQSGRCIVIIHTRASTPEGFLFPYMGPQLQANTFYEIEMLVA